MKKLILATGLAAISTAALAVFFFSASALVDSNGSLIVSFDERGLGNSNVTYSLSASGTAVYACFNNGGNHPQSTNKMGPAVLTAPATSFQAKNGRIQASIPLGPPGPGNFSCPSGQTEELACSDVMLKDTTNGIEADVAGTFSRTFISTRGVSC